MRRTTLKRRERSLASRLFLLIIIFIAVPVALYQTFKDAEQDRQTLLYDTVQEQGRLVGLGLRPLLQRTDPSPLLTIGDELQRFGSPNIRLKVLFRPIAQQDVKGFFFVASSPVVPTDALQREQEDLLRQGILDNVMEKCTGNVTRTKRFRDPEGQEEVLTSVTPILTPAGCWMIVVSHPLESLLGSSLSEPVWMRFEVRVAAAIYLGMAVLILAVFLSIRGGIVRFRELARDLRTGDAGDQSFASQNRLVELSGVAEEFDRLIQTLRASADGIRNAAEDNAHAMKTPIAIMRQSLEPLKRLVPAGEARGRRAIAVLENSIDRLDQLVSTARRMDEAMAELLDPPRQRVDLSRLLKRMMVAYGTIFDSRRLRLVADIEDSVVVRASEDLLETVVENIVDNSISVSPAEGKIKVVLRRDKRWAELTVVDEGPGVPSEDLERIFERRFSKRPQNGDQASEGAAIGDSVHAGIGLWIVRRNIEAIGGQVEARNEPTRGLSMRIQVPLAN